MSTIKKPWGIIRKGGDGFAAVTGGNFSYRINLAGCTASDEDTLLDLAAEPTADTHGATLRFVESYGPDPETGAGGRTIVQVVDAVNSDNPRTRQASYYELTTFGTSEEIELAAEPKFRLVAMDETRYWHDTVTNVTGRIQSISMYDENQTTNVCELTPSYYLEFLYNVPEHVPEAEDGNGPTIPGYDDFSAFERDNGDEPGCYTHCRDVDRLDDRFKHDLPQAGAETIERYRCAPPHLREELYRELTEEVREYPLCNRVFEGCFDPVETPAPSP